MNIEETHTFLEYEIKTARANKRLTPQARQADIARAYVTAKDVADGLFREAEVQAARDARTFKRKAFARAKGTVSDPSSAISRRDAADRAAMITDPVEAARLLRVAEDHGDEDLAAAIAERSHAQAAMVGRISDGDNPWRQVVAEYAAERPTVREALGQLAQVPDFNDPAQRMHIAMRYSVQKPTEIEALSDHQIEMLAATETEDEAV